MAHRAVLNCEDQPSSPASRTLARDPSTRERVFSVLLDQHLLVERGTPAANLAACVLYCWGGTIGDFTVLARSGLGIARSGQIVRAAGEQISPASLATVLLDAGAVRAIELDINPFWVAGYLYTQHPYGSVPVPIVPPSTASGGACSLPTRATSSPSSRTRAIL
jgi:hypothetical protein